VTANFQGSRPVGIVGAMETTTSRRDHRSPWPRWGPSPAILSGTAGSFRERQPPGAFDDRAQLYRFEKYMYRYDSSERATKRGEPGAAKAKREEERDIRKTGTLDRLRASYLRAITVFTRDCIPSRMSAVIAPRGIYMTPCVLSTAGNGTDSCVGQQVVSQASLAAIQAPTGHQPAGHRRAALPEANPQHRCPATVRARRLRRMGVHGAVHILQLAARLELGQHRSFVQSQIVHPTRR